MEVEEGSPNSSEEWTWEGQPNKQTPGLCDPLHHRAKRLEKKLKVQRYISKLF
jgi:hypothetical protein